MYQLLTHTPSQPWNKGKLLGQKPPLKLREIWAIRIRLQRARRTRDLALFNLAIGWANDFARASADHPGGYALGMWIFSGLGFLGLLFALLLFRVESGPRSHGLDTITAASKT